MFKIYAKIDWRDIVNVFLPFILFFCVSAPGISQTPDSYLSGKGTFNGTALIVCKGKILLYKGYGYKNAQLRTFNDTATIYRIGSLSKPFTAAVIPRLEQEGLLNFYDPVSKYIPGYPNGNTITIEALLTHCSGVRDYLEVKTVQQLPDSAPPISMNKLISYFKDEPPTMKAGEKFSYSNSNYILLASVIEKITGEKFERVVRKIIFDPLQMNHSGFDFRNLKDTCKSTGHTSLKKKMVVADFDSTYAPGCGSMFTTAMDLYKWYKGLYAGLVINDTARERSFTPRQWKYGYGWFRYSLYGKKCVSHPGGVPGFVADMKFFPDDDLCIILLSNSSIGKANADKLASLVFQMPYKSSGL
jgi:CubicO group peptidase (beta-lactamase class C family)